MAEIPCYPMCSEMNSCFKSGVEVMRTSLRQFHFLKVGPCVFVLALTGFLGNWSQGEARAQGQGKVYTTNKTFFHLPIQIDSGARAQLREVILFVKEGQGPWQKKVVARPTDEHFSYRVKDDGEYWFSVVTVNLQGKSYPEDVSKEPPALMVKVDTTLPKATMTQTQQTNGEQAIRCEIKDANPDYGRLKVAYLGQDQNWHDLAPVLASPGLFDFPKETVLNGTFRYEATDKAGNSNTGIVHVKLQTPTTVVQAPKTPENLPAAAVIPPLPEPKQSTEPKSEVPALTPPSLQDSTSLQPTVPEMPEAKQPFAPSNIQRTNHKIAVPEIPAPNDTIKNNVPEPKNNLPETKTPVNGGPSRQLLNTRKASIDYRLDQVGPSGVSRVDVWVLAENSYSWQRMATDADQRTPVDVELPGDGVYGIWLAVTNGNGFGGKAPQRNDQPNFWLEVDTTPPYAQINGVDLVSSTGTLEFRWSASDKNLDKNGITLAYAPQPTGPWTPIAQRLENQGTFSWKFPKSLPPQFFVRMEVRDRAGNVTQSSWPNPIQLDLTEPRALVIGVNGRRDN